LAILCCAHCRQRNRVPLATGTKGLTCGRCEADLPTPAILWRLHQVRDELDQLLKEYRWWDPRVQQRVELRLERQHSILANAAAAYPGFGRTCRASPDVVADIEAKSNELLKKLDHAAMRIGLRILLVIVSLVRITFDVGGGPPALPPGSAH
jgi:hypothetical protein